MIKKNNKWKLEIYRCAVCGNLIVKLHDSGLTPVCCGRDMELIEPGTSDGAVEKHVPVFKMCGSKIEIQVGETAHPMIDSHYIQWIIVETDKGVLSKHLCPEEEPTACFKLCKNEHILNIYEYCNIHGLFKADLEDKKNECPLCRF